MTKYLHSVRSLFTLFLVMLLTQVGVGQVTLAGWDFSTLSGGSNNFGSSPRNPSTTASNITVGGLTRGSGVSTTGTGAARAYGGVGWDNAASVSTSANNISNSKFFSFTIKSNSGYALSLSAISVFDYRRSSTGAPSGLLQYQINSGTFTDIQILSFSATVNTGGSLSSIDLSTISALQNLSSSTTVTFRIVPYGTGTSTGTWYFYDKGASTADDFVITGTVASPPASPTISSITPGNGQLSVAFTPGSDGGAAITTYKYSTDGGTNWQTRATGTTASPLVITTLSSDGITSLSNGTSYNVQIRAVNAAGDGTASTTTQAIPLITYYSKSSGNLEDPNNWGDNPDGSGAGSPPANFTLAGSVYEIRNRSTATIGANWSVSGVNSKVVVGDGTNAVDFSIPDGMSLTLSCDLTNRSTISGAGAVIMNGSAAQTISGTGTISNLTIANTSGGVSISSGVQSLTGILTPTSGTLTTNGNLTLKSSASGTARVAQRGTGTITGDVVVERYFGSNKQAWRLVTAPVVQGAFSSTIFNNWQVANSVAGVTGVEIWGPGGTAAPIGSGGATGLALHPTVSSMRGWSNNTSTPGFVNVTNTKSTDLFPASGNPTSFFLFVAGPLGDGSVPTGYTPAKVRSIGSLRQGDQSFSITSAVLGKYYLVGNPYASPVNYADVQTVNVDNPVWVWDPNLNGQHSAGGYLAFDRANKTYNVVSTGGGSTVYTGGATTYTRLQSGQAFFVRATASANLSVDFKESDKGDAVTGSTFRITNDLQSEKMRVTLQSNFNGEYNTTDGAVAFFYQDGEKGIDRMDGRKMMNATNNIMFRRDGINLTFEHRPRVESTDTLFLNLRSTSAGKYRLLIEGWDFESSRNLTPILQDTYLNQEQPLSLDAAVPYEFEIGDNSASGGERFRIVFTSKAINPPQNIDPRNTILVYPNPVSGSGQLNLKFNNRPAGNYTIVFNNLQGARMQQQVISHAGGTAVQNIKLNSSLPSGTYFVNILDASSQKVESLKVIIQ